jgi:hypothetical protein
MRIVAGVGDLVQRTGDGPTGRVLGGRVSVCFMLCMQCSYVHMQCFVCNALIFIYFVKNVGSVTKPMRHIFWTDMSHMCHACDM